MAEHELRLAAEPFENITSGKKTIESRLFDEKRQAIKLGDTIIFTNREHPSQTQRVKVVGLMRYNSFADLFRYNDPAKFGGDSEEWLLSRIGEFYSLDDQNQNGVIGIEFVLLK